jgi:hypothetical protein
MATYGPQILQDIFEVTPITYAWKICLYLDGQDPLVDMAAAEIGSSRTTLPAMEIDPIDATKISNAADFTISGVGTCTAAGWFVCDDVATVPAFVGTFAAPVGITSGQDVNFPANAIKLGMS